MLKFVELKSKGQIDLGDTLAIVGKGKSDNQMVTVEDVISIGGGEEVIIDKEFNRYFITDLYLSGDSWARKVFVLKELEEK